MRFSVSAVVLSFCAVMAHASPMPQSPPAGVDLSKVYIEDATFAGSGCPAGSVQVSKSADWTNIILSFGSYSASIGPDIPFAQRRRNCNLNIKFHFPFGLQITVYKTDYAGYASLEDKVKATHQSDYWFSGFANDKATASNTLVGPLSDSYSISDTFNHRQTVLSPCGDSTTLNINSQLFLDSSANPSGSGSISIDTISHTTTTKLYIGLRLC